MFHRAEFRKHDKTLLTILAQSDWLYTAQTPTLANSSMLAIFCLSDNSESKTVLD